MKLFHYLLLLGLLARPCLLTRPELSCESKSLQLKHDYTNTRYPDSCANVESLADFAICLAQRNSFNKLLHCGSLPDKQAWWAPVPTGAFLDGAEILPGWNPDHYDGKFWFTPKLLLTIIARAESCPVTYRDLGRSFMTCPFQSVASYVHCLCCERVEPWELHSLRNKCVYPPRGSFWVKESVLNNEPAIDYSCDGACIRPRRRDGQCPAGSIDFPRDPSNPECVEFVVDGVPQPVPQDLRRDVEGEIDYSSLFEKYPLWVTDDPLPAPTRNIPTASSRTFDFAYESDYPIETVSEGEGEDDDFVSHESTPTVADTTPTVADTTTTVADTTESGEPNVGAVFSSTDHIMLAFGLALVNLYHAMA